MLFKVPETFLCWNVAYPMIKHASWYIIRIPLFIYLQVNWTVQWLLHSLGIATADSNTKYMKRILLTWILCYGYAAQTGPGTITSNNVNLSTWILWFTIDADTIHYNVKMDTFKWFGYCSKDFVCPNWTNVACSIAGQAKIFCSTWFVRPKY